MAKKILSFVLTIVMVAALAVPAIAAGHKVPEIVITNETADGYYVAGATIKYELTLADGDASTIKVGNKTLKISDFKENEDGSFTYKGTYTLGLTDTNLKFYVYDMDQATSATFEETIKLKVDPTTPAVKASGITTGSAFKIGIISIIATDNIGLDKIAVNGKTIADRDDFTNKKSYVTNYEVPAAGSYIITVTDTAGNVAINTVKFNEDGSATSENVSNPVGGSIWNGGYLGGLLDVYKDNPQLYYYIKMLQTNGNFDDLKDNWVLWYFLNNGNITLPGAGSTTTAPSIDNNWYFIYNYLLKNEDMSAADAQMLLALLSGKVDVSGNNLYWYLFNNKEFDIDKNLLYYLYNVNNGSIPSFNVNENYLAYKYFFGTLADNLEITSNTKERVLTLTAPEARESFHVSYTWKMNVNGTWKTVGSDSKTLDVEPNVGDQYKVILSSDYYYTTVESEVYTVTAADKLPDFSAPVEEEVVEDKEAFTSDDITINGVSNNSIRLKVGQKAYLVPNVNGFWSFDSEMFTGTGSSLIVLTAKKAGTSVALFTGVNSDGQTATKAILINVVE